MISDEMVEKACRLMCAEKLINPDALHQYHGDGPVDQVTGDGRKFIYGWRIQERFVRAVAPAFDSLGSQLLGEAVETAPKTPFAWFWWSIRVGTAFPVWSMGSERPPEAPATAFALYASLPVPSEGELGMADEDRAFNLWRDSLPEKHWAKYDLSACRLGWDARSALSISPDSRSGELERGKFRAVWAVVEEYRRRHERRDDPTLGACEVCQLISSLDQAARSPSAASAGEGEPADDTEELKAEVKRLRSKVGDGQFILDLENLPSTRITSFDGDGPVIDPSQQGGEKP